ncbi:hypothetical protein EJ08DRAFT_653671 [Tothia fuscella]|uniref:Origin recognition complex subunit 3 n=1 Tax=Tothia fuscella TaxID=1048955 RepID=A0A9P4NGM3_9PEZI|nr:hypothetical protein EJ08DRAFT_653671 [Tothia fuscella]
MEHEKTYVFSSKSERPNKRRRVEPSGLDSSWSLREQTYQQLWREQQRRVQKVLDDANRTTLDELLGFVKESEEVEEDRKLPSGMILAGPSIAAHATFFDQLSERIGEETSSSFTLITSTDSANLKSLLKVLIKSATSQKSLDDGEDELITRKRKGPKILDYDLQLLHEWALDNDNPQVIVAFRDSEAFDENVLSEAVELLGLWSDRIQFVLLFGIATSIDNLQERLSQRATRFIRGQQFDVVQAKEILERIFFTITAEENVPLRLGSQLSRVLQERHEEHIQSVQDFVDAVQYAYMAHFFANPLSVFLRLTLDFTDLAKEHFTAFRNLPSFRRHIEDLLKERKNVSKVRKLLDSDQALFDTATNTIRRTQNAVDAVIQAASVLYICRSHFSQMRSVSRSAFFITALAGQLSASPTLREALLALKKCSSDVLLRILQDISPVLRSPSDSMVSNIQSRLSNLLRDVSGKREPLRSEHDNRNETQRTTIVASKVLLSRHKSNLSEQDAEYTKLLNEFVNWLSAYLEEHLIDPKNLFMHELVLYDLRAPHQGAFVPQTRHAIEQALFAPHDYLGCSCCVPTNDASEEVALAGSTPPTALLYRLYLESGALINVSDLWSAFNAILEDGGEDDSSKVMPLFQQALAELKTLGMIKSTRKKTDHISKVAWRGL